MTTANKVCGIIGVLTGFVYLILALAGAEGIVWVFPAVAAGMAYSIMGVLARPEPRKRDRRRGRRR